MIFSHNTITITIQFIIQLLMSPTSSSICMWYPFFGGVRGLLLITHVFGPLEPCPFLDMRPPWFLSEPENHLIEVIPNSKIYAWMIMYKIKNATQTIIINHHQKPPKNPHKKSSSKYGPTLEPQGSQSQAYL